MPQPTIELRQPCLSSAVPRSPREHVAVHWCNRISFRGEDPPGHRTERSAKLSQLADELFAGWDDPLLSLLVVRGAPPNGALIPIHIFPPELANRAESSAGALS